MVIGAFGALDPDERKDLPEAAEEGDEQALEELRAERVEAIEAMIGALDDEDARKLIKLGMLLGGIRRGSFAEAGGDPDRYTPGTRETSSGVQNKIEAQVGKVSEKLEVYTENFNFHAETMLDMVQEQLESVLILSRSW